MVNDKGNFCLSVPDELIGTSKNEVLETLEVVCTRRFYVQNYQAMETIAKKVLTELDMKA